MNTPLELTDAVRKWLVKAAHDLKAAEHLLTLPDPECPLDNVCFHAQQCAEKSLKGFLTFQRISFGKTHDLGQLLFLCRKTPKLVTELEPLKEFTFYAVDIRYPELVSEEVTRSEALRALRLARKAHKIVRQRLKGILKFAS